MSRDAMALSPPNFIQCCEVLERKMTTQEDVEDVRRKIQIMHHLEGNPNVIKIVGAYEDAVAGGELFDRIIERGHYTEKKAAQLAKIIVGVVDAFHSLGDELSSFPDLLIET